MSDAVYPYRVTFNRTAQWYPNSSTYGNGDWIKMSEWCDSSIGPGNWDYYWNEFVFSREEDYMLFKLKWL